MKRRIASKIVALSVLVTTTCLVLGASAFAHVTVKPAEVLSGSYQTFTTNVPNEKEVPVTAIRLVIPINVTSVTPTVKPGWEITTKKSGEQVTEIIWTSGTINAGLRDEFTFSAKTPDVTGEITWKAYQTYQDGSVVAWDQKPSVDHSHASEDESKGPYSVTTVNEEDFTAFQVGESTTSNSAVYVLSGIAVIFSAAALVLAIRR